MNQLNCVLLLTVLGMCACTGRSTNTGTAPAPRPAAQDSGEQTTTTPTSQTQTTPTEDSEQSIGTQNGDQSTNDDVIDPNATTSTTSTDTSTPSTTGDSVDTPTTQTPATPANNPTGTVNIQGSDITFQDLRFAIPSGWKLHQDAMSDGTLIMAFSKGSDYFRIYAKQGTLPSLQSIFVNGSQVVGQERDESIGGRSWKRIDTQKGQVSVSGFALSLSGHAYYGFGRSTSGPAAKAAAAEFLGAMKQ